MAGMRDIKRRIRSIKNTQQITKAMKMVAAAKLRRAQMRALRSRPYAEKVREVLARLVAESGPIKHPLLTVREPKKIGYIVVTADRGLCGGYNVNIIRMANRMIGERGGDAGVIAVGRKARDYFARHTNYLSESFVNLGDEISLTDARIIGEKIIKLYQEAVFDELYLIYTEFINAMQQRPKEIRLLPLVKPDGEQGRKIRDYIYEPSPEGVLGRLLPRYIENVLYNALLEAKASEHGARMTAMGSATDNAAEMIDKLTLSFNRARQAAITKEISEIVGGAEALKALK